MPWKIERRDTHYAVVNQDTGETVHTFPTKDKALAQLRALYANVPEARHKALLFSHFWKFNPNHEPAGTPAGGRFAGGDGAGVTATPEFKAWFSGSRVVDASGKPVVLYHGTQGNYSTLRASTGLNAWLGEGIYLTESVVNANAYAGTKAGANIMPVFAAIKRPFKLDLDSGRVPGEFAGLIDEEAIQLDRATPEKIHRLTESLKRQGYDGVIAYHGLRTGHERDGQAILEAVAFYPHQVKSAIGNRGTFSSTDPDITKFNPHHVPAGSPAGGQFTTGPAMAAPGTNGAWLTTPPQGPFLYNAAMASQFGAEPSLSTATRQRRRAAIAEEDAVVERRPTKEEAPSTPVHVGQKFALAGIEFPPAMAKAGWTPEIIGEILSRMVEKDSDDEAQGAKRKVLALSTGEYAAFVTPAGEIARLAVDREHYAAMRDSFAQTVRAPEQADALQVAATSDADRTLHPTYGPFDVMHPLLASGVLRVRVAPSGLYATMDHRKYPTRQQLEVVDDWIGRATRKSGKLLVIETGRIGIPARDYDALDADQKMSGGAVVLGQNTPLENYSASDAFDLLATAYKRGKAIIKVLVGPVDFVTVMKFNPNHDPEDGRFTSGSGGTGAGGVGTEDVPTSEQVVTALVARHGVTTIEDWRHANWIAPLGGLIAREGPNYGERDAGGPPADYTHHQDSALEAGLTEEDVMDAGVLRLLTVAVPPGSRARTGELNITASKKPTEEQIRTVQALIRTMRAEGQLGSMIWSDLSPDTIENKERFKQWVEGDKLQTPPLNQWMHDLYGRPVVKLFADVSKFNSRHKPAGPGGGQFDTKDGGLTSTTITTPLPARVRGTRLMDLMAKAVKDDGGFTLDDRTHTSVVRPGAGYSVGVFPQYSGQFDAATFTVKDAATWLTTYRKKIRDPRIMVGGWHDQESGKVWLDLVRVYPRNQRDIALRVGAKRNQISIADLDAIARNDWDHAILPTGGTGAVKKRTFTKRFVLFDGDVSAEALVAAFKVEKFNPNHDPEDGKFTSGTSGPGGEKSDEEVFQAAKEEFGVTEYLTPGSGYLLPDGMWLELGYQSGGRDEDHRAISRVEEDIEGDDTGSQAMVRFQERGAVRVSLYGQSDRDDNEMTLDFESPINRAQRSAIAQAIQDMHIGTVYLDFYASNSQKRGAGAIQDSPSEVQTHGRPGPLLEVLDHAFYNDVGKRGLIAGLRRLIAKLNPYHEPSPLAKDLRALLTKFNPNHDPADGRFTSGSTVDQVGGAMAEMLGSEAAADFYERMTQGMGIPAGSNTSRQEKVKQQAEGAVTAFQTKIHLSSGEVPHPGLQAWAEQYAKAYMQEAVDPTWELPDDMAITPFASNDPKQANQASASTLTFKIGDTEYKTFVDLHVPEMPAEVMRDTTLDALIHAANLPARMEARPDLPEQRWWVARETRDIVAHELVHVKHLTAMHRAFAGRIGYREWHAQLAVSAAWENNIPVYARLNGDRKIARSVSVYASRSPLEFVAEAGTVLRQGGTLTPEQRDLYFRLHGPEVTPR